MSIKTHHSQKFRELIKSYGLSEGKLDPQMVYDFQTLVELITHYLNKELACDRGEFYLRDRVLETMEIITAANGQISIHFVMKKLLFLQFFIQWTEERSTGVTELLSKEINKIIKQDLAKICRPRSKSFINLEKISTFIRELSSSKKPSSKMKLEELDEKSAIKTICFQIIEPYCHYLLKIINSNEIYNSILKRKEKTSSKDVQWKIINWSISLSKIVFNLNKIGRYFGEQFKGVWIFFCYMISQDQTVYYEILREYIERESNKWLQKLLITKKFYKINKKTSNFQQNELQELYNLKKMIDEFNRIKEDLNFLYINKRLMQWQSSFKLIRRPITSLKLNSSNELLDLIESLSKYKEFKDIFAHSPVKETVKVHNSLTISTKVDEKSQYYSEDDLPTNTQQVSNNLQAILKSSEKQPQPRRRNIFSEKRNRLLGRS